MRKSPARGLPRLIGVIHLPALPGAPGAPDDAPTALQNAGLRAVQEAVQLVRAGFEGIILENFGDVPFYRDEVPPETIASMAVVAAAVREAVSVPIGINVLRNDARAALAIAAVAGCQFIRVNVLSGIAASDQGWLEGRAAELARERRRIAPGVAILADAQVKHAKTLSSDDIEIAIEDLSQRALADGVIVTGATTGRSVDDTLLVRACRAATRLRSPLYIGSGSTPAELAHLLELADGVIVGSALRRGGRAGAPLDTARLKEFVRAWRAASGARTPASRGKNPATKKVRRNASRKVSGN